MSVSTLTMPLAPVDFAAASIEAGVAATEGEFYELVDERRVEVPPMSAYAAKVASRLARRLGDAADDRQLGEVVVEGLFRIPQAEDRKRNRRPDIAFVSFERWPADRPQHQTDNAWDVVPDLAVEVISPTDGFEDIMAKVAEYFRGGVRLVWVLMPIVRQVLVFDAPGAVRLVTDAGSLDGAAVVPGFALPLANLLDAPRPAADPD